MTRHASVEAKFEGGDVGKAMIVARLRPILEPRLDHLQREDAMPPWSV